MKFGTTEISQLSDQALTGAYFNCGQVEKQREEASKHPKFTTEKKKIDFPPINPAFVQMKNEIELEMKKRKLL